MSNLHLCCILACLQAIFDMIDSDGNGFVDFVEYMIAVSANRSDANETQRMTKVNF